MKNFKKLLCFVVVFASAACSKEWLELEQPGNNDKPYFVDAGSAYEAVIAAYDVQAWRMNVVTLWAVGSIMSDDAVKGGESPGDQQGMYDCMNFNATPNTDIPSWIWGDLYRMIARASFAIDIMIEQDASGEYNIPMDLDLRNRFIAECRFLRGYSYFRLVRNFGGVMLYTSAEDDGTTHGSDLSNVRATPEQVYSQVEADLLFASQYLPATIPLAEQGRATKGAADGLLAKAYLYQEKWEEAKAQCEEVVNSGLYGLEPNYGDVFSSAKQWGQEVVYSLNMVEDPDGNWGEHEGSWLSIWFGDRDMGWGYGFRCPTIDFVNSFEPGDSRYDATIVEDGESIPGIFGGAPHDFTGGSWNPPTGFMGQKYLIPDTERPVTADCNGNLDYIFLRYADILLMHAEASMEIGDNGAAENSLNLVRNRAGLGDYDASAPVISTYKETSLLGHDPLKASIYHERRVEFGLESERFYDLVRWGDAATVLQNFNDNGQTYGKNNFVSGCSELLPIPAGDISASNGAIEQNPCY